MALRIYREIADISQLPAPDETGYIARYVFQYIDFFQVPQYVAAGHRFTDCCFLGCDIPSAMDGQIGNTCLVFPRMPASIPNTRTLTATASTPASMRITWKRARNATTSGRCWAGPCTTGR